MTNAQRDENSHPTMICALNTDGVSIVRVKVTPGHKLKIDDDTTGTDNGRLPALRDENSVPIFMGVSSVDGVTPVPIYANSSGELLVDSN
jgi:hypothetical protein